MSNPFASGETGGKNATFFGGDTETESNGSPFGAKTVTELKNPFGATTTPIDDNAANETPIIERFTAPPVPIESTPLDTGSDVGSAVTPPQALTPPPVFADDEPDYPPTPSDLDRLDITSVKIPFEDDDVVVNTDSVVVEGLVTIVGECKDMCPMVDSELTRTRNIYFETTDKAPSDVDLKRVVKSYARSDAGRRVEPQLIRTPQCLYKTTLFLLRDILKRENEHKTWLNPEGRSSRVISFIEIFAFMRDRLRCVRNDFIIQSHVSLWSVRCLEYTVRFHIMSGHLLCGHPLEKGFDPKGNRDMLDDALIDRLWSYYAAFREKYKDPKTDRPVPGVPALKNIAEFAAYRLLYKELRQHDDHKKWRESTNHNAPWDVQGNSHRSTDNELAALAVMPEVIEHPLVLFSMKILGYYTCDDWPSFFKAVSTAPYLQACLMVNVFPFVRVMYMSQLWRGTAKNEALKAEDLQRKLHFEEMKQLERFLKAIEFKLEVSETDGTLQVESKQNSKKSALPQCDGCKAYMMRCPSERVEARRCHRSHLAVCLGEGEVWPDDPSAPPVVVKQFVAPEISIPVVPPVMVLETPATVELPGEDAEPEGDNEEPCEEKAEEAAVLEPEAIKHSSPQMTLPAPAEPSPLKPSVPSPLKPPVHLPVPSPIKPEVLSTPERPTDLAPEPDSAAVTETSPESECHPMPPPNLPPLPAPEPVGLSGSTMTQLNAEEAANRSSLGRECAVAQAELTRECTEGASKLRRLRDFHAADGMKKLLKFSRDQFTKETHSRGYMLQQAETPAEVRMQLFPQCLMNLRQHQDMSPVLAAVSAAPKGRSSEYRVLLCSKVDRVNEKMAADEAWRFIGGVHDAVHGSMSYKNEIGQRVKYRVWRTEGIANQTVQCFAHTMVFPVTGDPASAARYVASEVGVAVAAQATQGQQLLGGVILLYFSEIQTVPSSYLAAACEQAFEESGLGFISVCAVNLSEGYTREDVIRSWSGVARPRAQQGSSVPLHALLSDAACSATSMLGGVPGWALTEHYAPEGSKAGLSVMRHVKKICSIVIDAAAEALGECGVCELADNSNTIKHGWDEGMQEVVGCGRAAPDVMSDLLRSEANPASGTSPLEELCCQARGVFGEDIGGLIQRCLTAVSSKGQHTVHGVMTLLVTIVLTNMQTKRTMMACPMFTLPVLRRYLNTCIQNRMTPLIRSRDVHHDFAVLMEIQQKQEAALVEVEVAPIHVPPSTPEPLFEKLSSAVDVPMVAMQKSEEETKQAVLPSGVLKRLREMASPALNTTPSLSPVQLWEPSNDDIDTLIDAAIPRSPPRVVHDISPPAVTPSFDDFRSDTLQYMKSKRVKLEG